MKNIIVLAAGKAERMGDIYPQSKLFLSKGAVPIISNIIETFSDLENRFVFCIRQYQETLVRSYLELAHPKLNYQIIAENTNSVLETLNLAVERVSYKRVPTIVTVADSFYATKLNSFILEDKWIAVAKKEEDSKDYILTTQPYHPVKWLNKPMKLENRFLAFTGTFCVPSLDYLKEVLAESKTLYSLITRLDFKILVDLTNHWTDLGTKDRYDKARAKDFLRKLYDETFILNNCVIKYFVFPERLDTYKTRLSQKFKASYKFIKTDYLKGSDIEHLTMSDMTSLFSERVDLLNKIHEKTLLKRSSSVLQGLNSGRGQNNHITGVTSTLLDKASSILQTLDLGFSYSLNKVHGDTTVQNIIRTPLSNRKSKVSLIDPSSSTFLPLGTTLLYELSKLYASVNYNFKSFSEGAFYLTLENNYVSRVLVKNQFFNTHNILKFALKHGITSHQLEVCAALHLICMSGNYYNKDVNNAFLHLGIADLIYLNSKQ